MTSDTRWTDASGERSPRDHPKRRGSGGTPPAPQAAGPSTPLETQEPPESIAARGRRRLRRRAWLLVPVMTIAFGIAGDLYSLMSEVTYSASALVQIDPATVSPRESLDQIDDQEISTQRLVMNSEAVASKVVTALQLDSSVQSIQDSVIVAQVNDSRVLRVTATRDNPDSAASVANAFAEQYLAFRTAQRDAQLSQVTKAGTSELRPGPVGEVLTPAVASDVPAGVSPRLLIAMSALLGLLVGIVLALLLERRGVAGQGGPVQG